MPDSSRPAAHAAAVSRLARSPHLGAALGALALVVAAAALVVTLTRGDPKAPALAKRIVSVSNVTAKHDTGDKEIRADCPRGTMLLGGGSAVQHGNESPSVAMYPGYPVANGWEVQAHLTNPPKTTRFPNWDLFAVAICLRT
jgi:hypothetical protein